MYVGVCMLVYACWLVLLGACWCVIAGACFWCACWCVHVGVCVLVRASLCVHDVSGMLMNECMYVC